MSGSGISWAICKSAPRSRQITTPVPHHSVFYRLDALPAAQPTPSRHWRQPERRLWLLCIFHFSLVPPCIVCICMQIATRTGRCLSGHVSSSSYSIAWSRLRASDNWPPSLLSMDYWTITRSSVPRRGRRRLTIGIIAVGCAGSMMIQFSRTQSSLTSGYILNVPAFQLFVPYFSLITLGTGHWLLTSNRTVE